MLSWERNHTALLLGLSARGWTTQRISLAILEDQTKRLPVAGRKDDD